MQGVWQVTAMENNGTALPTAEVASASLTIKGNWYRLASKNGSLNGIFTVDASKSQSKSRSNRATMARMALRCWAYRIWRTAASGYVMASPAAIARQILRRTIRSAR